MAPASPALAAGEPEVEAMTSYIVHVASSHAPRPSRRRALAQAYASFLRNQLPTHLLHPTPSVHYSYRHAATGFAARLTGRQAAHLEAQPSVLAVVPDTMLQLHTTMTPSFLRLSASSGVLPASNGAMDVVIGVIDTGIYPKGRASFAADPSLTRPPGTFRGGCVSTPSFNSSAFCNNKLVAAKFFYRGYKALNGRPADEADESLSPLDVNGHGTHTASTAAGSAAAGAGFYNYGKGTAVGVAPNARIAAYKACWERGCADSDILAAFDEAIGDRVNVISYSIGPVGTVPKLHRDNAAVGAFSAIRKGIVVSASAGNDGPGESTVGNIAPWMLTVGASTINRRYAATVILGNGDAFNGTSLYVGKPLNATKIALVYGGSVGSDVCEAGKLDKALVAGKIVLCDDHDDREDEVAQGEAVKLAGGAGAIFGSSEDSGELPNTSPHILPATAITFTAAKKIKKYISTHASPVATIALHGTIISSTPSSPRMASFSSRGPNLHAPEILKPDITAPGVDILAAWTGKKSPSGLDNDKRRVEYNVISGTSMSCPHVSGIAALLRQAQPDWSPAAIKSAIMTTAYVLDNASNVIRDTSTGRASTPFVYGAGHVDPNRAVDPGLVYDAGVKEYISFLCALGYTSREIEIFTRDGSKADYCSTRTGSPGDFNYPAFSVVFHSDMDEVTQRRSVRNVGSNISTTYRARIISPAGVRVTVEPRKLQFTATQKTREYAITFAPRGEARVTDKYTFGSIVWSDGEHKVTSPIAITWPVSQVAAS
ncbi:unnamed protein product [Urochloa humidicola]